MSCPLSSESLPCKAVFTHSVNDFLTSMVACPHFWPLSKMPWQCGTGLENSSKLYWAFCWWNLSSRDGFKPNASQGVETGLLNQLHWDKGITCSICDSNGAGSRVQRALSALLSSHGDASGQDQVWSSATWKLSSSCRWAENRSHNSSGDSNAIGLMELLTERGRGLNFAAFNYSSSHHSVHLEWQGEYFTWAGLCWVGWETACWYLWW